jgi:formylglycine-generating enzyme required for sulfatase activity
VDHRADLFSLGSVLYAMLTGRPPFRATTTLAVLKRVAEDDPRPIREINPEAPEWLAAIVARLHAKDPAGRFPSAREVADLLAKYQSELQSTGTVTVGDAERAEVRKHPDDVTNGSLTRRRSPARRRRWLAAGVVLAVAAVLAAVFAGDFLYLVFTNQGRVVVEDLGGDMEVTIVTDGVVRYDHSTRTEFELHHNDNVVLRFTPASGGAELFRKDFALPRGRTVRVNAVTELAAVEERNRARVGNNLAAIGRAVNDFPGAWTSLFDGTDLTGWQSLGKDPWVVTDGMLVGTGTDGYLRTDREDFGDFHLRAEMQLAAGTNSGLFFRGGPVRAGQSGYEADVTLGAEPTRTGSLLKYPAKQWVLHEEKRGLLKPDEWTRVEVIAVGRRLTVKVDGVTTADLEDADHARGHIGLQVRGSPGTVRVRKIEVRELSPYIQDSGRPARPPEPPRAVAPFDANKAKELQKMWAKYLGVDVEVTNSVGMKLRLIPPGEFTMGTGRDDLDRIAKDIREDWVKEALATEAPARPAKIDAPFYMGECEVPVSAFRAFVKATGYRTTAETNGRGGRQYVVRGGKGEVESRSEWTWQHASFTGSEDLPVVEVSLKDAEAFCAWLTEKEGRQYVVPNERQWEYACRAGTTTRWWNGDVEGDVFDIGWAAGNATFFRPVGGKPGNPFGLRDMHGNVEEVCAVVGGGAVARGGLWGSPRLLCRSATRFPIPEDEVWAGRGFRVAVVGDLKATK